MFLLLRRLAEGGRSFVFYLIEHGKGVKADYGH